MNNYSILKIAFVIGLLAFFTSCEEEPPSIEMTVADSRDTSYLDLNNIPEPQSKGVVIEEYTGVRCTNCHGAHQVAKDIKNNHPGRVVLLAHHTNSHMLATPHNHSTHDFRNETSNVIHDMLGGTSGIPAAAVDRVHFDGEDRINVRPERWAPLTNQRLELNTVVNIESEYNESDKLVKVKLFYTAQAENNHYLTVLIAENGLIDPQSSNDGVIDEYVHDYIVRKALTSRRGDLINETLESGRVIERFFNIELEESWTEENLSIVVIVHERSDKYNVENVREMPLKP